MEFTFNEIVWELPFSIKIFLIIFMFALLWLYFYFHHHYVLVFKLKKHLKFFKNLLMAKTPEVEIGSIIEKQLKKAKNPQVKTLYRSFSALVTAPTESREHVAQNHKKEIDYFLARRELQIKGLALVLIFSMAGLILMEIKILMTDVNNLSPVTSPSFLFHLIPYLEANIYYNLFKPMILALSETFLVFWLINSVKKLRLWLDHEWTNLLEVV